MVAAAFFASALSGNEENAEGCDATVDASGTKPVS